MTYGKGIRKGALAAARKHGPKDGEALFKWARRILIASCAAGVGYAANLMTLFPKDFGWLRAVFEFLKSMT